MDRLSTIRAGHIARRTFTQISPCATLRHRPTGTTCHHKGGSMKLLSRAALSAATALALIPTVAVSAAHAATPSIYTDSAATDISSLPTTITQDTGQATTDS